MSKLFIDIEKNVNVKTWTFPAGEAHCKLTEDAVAQIKKGAKITVFNRCQSASDFMLTYFVLDAIDRLKPPSKDIELMLPYLPYQQADRVFSEGEPLGVSVIDMLTNWYDITANITSYDVHSGVGANFVAKELSPKEAILCLLQTYEPQELCVFFPDKGAFERMQRFDFWKEIDPAINLAFADKKRPNDGGEPIVSVSSENLAKVKDRHVLIVDDICVGGRTFVSLLGTLQGSGFLDVSLYVTHGVFSGDMGLLSNSFRGIFTTNTYRDFGNIKDPWVMKNERLLGGKIIVYDYDFSPHD